MQLFLVPPTITDTTSPALGRIGTLTMEPVAVVAAGRRRKPLKASWMRSNLCVGSSVSVPRTLVIRNWPAGDVLSALRVVPLPILPDRRKSNFTTEDLSNARLLTPVLVPVLAPVLVPVPVLFRLV